MLRIAYHVAYHMLYIAHYVVILQTYVHVEVGHSVAKVCEGELTSYECKASYDRRLFRSPIGSTGELRTNSCCQIA